MLHINPFELIHLKWYELNQRIKLTIYSIHVTRQFNQSVNRLVDWLIGLISLTDGQTCKTVEGSVSSQAIISPFFVSFAFLLLFLSFLSFPFLSCQFSLGRVGWDS